VVGQEEPSYDWGHHQPRLARRLRASEKDSRKYNLFSFNEDIDDELDAGTTEGERLQSPQHLVRFSDRVIVSKPRLAGRIAAPPVSSPGSGSRLEASAASRLDERCRITLKLTKLSPPLKVRWHGPCLHSCPWQGVCGGHAAS
jgi:hypothetical protein